MDARANKTLGKNRPSNLNQMVVARLMMGFLPLLMGAGLFLTSCQGGAGNNGMGEPTSPQGDATGESDTSSPSDDNTPDTATPTEPTTTASDTTADSSTAVLQSPNDATLPDTLTRQWEPASSVLFTFGPMTITPNQVQWESGQSSAYRVVSMDGGYLLELEESPSFYDTPNPFIKLIPKKDEAGNTTSLDIAFYESQGKAESEEYIMYGSYFVE
jgi:hypothetical protein